MISDVRDSIKLGLSQIKGLTVYKQPPNTVPKCPAFILDWDRTASDYLTPPGNTCHWYFRGVLLLAEKISTAAYKKLDEYIDKTGTKSIKANIENQSVGDWVVVKSCENPGVIVYMDKVFYGAEFLIDVADTT